MPGHAIDSSIFARLSSLDRLLSRSLHHGDDIIVKQLLFDVDLALATLELSGQPSVHLWHWLSGEQRVFCGAASTGHNFGFLIGFAISMQSAASQMILKPLTNKFFIKHLHGLLSLFGFVHRQPVNFLLE